MIKNKEDLILFLQKDKEALGIPSQMKRPKLYGYEIWKFQRALRYEEYYTNVTGGGFPSC